MSIPSLRAADLFVGVHVTDGVADIVAELSVGVPRLSVCRVDMFVVNIST